MKRICVFLGSSPGRHPGYSVITGRLGTLLAARRWTLVYGGANVGLMGVLADSMLAAGGQVIGVIPAGLLEKEVAHRDLSELHVVASMHERKSVMAELSDAVVAVPGGLGTLEEFFEMLTWGQLGLHAKPCGLLNARGYFDKLIEFLDHGVHERFIAPEHRQMVLVESEPAALLDRMERYRPPTVEKWLDRRTS